MAHRLLRASTPREVASLLLPPDAPLARRGARVVWSSQWPRNLHAHPAGAIDPGLIHRVAECRQRLRRGESGGDGLRLLCDDGLSVAVLMLPGERQGADGEVGELDIAGLRMAETMATERLRDTTRQAEASEKLQRALFAIADLSASSLDMPEMLRGIHRIVSDLMYAENFYIVRYDRTRDSLRFIYYVDVVDADAPPVDRDFPMEEFDGRLTWHLLRNGRPLMGTTEELRQQVDGDLRIEGADSIDWLGVPMTRDGAVHGALVVQTYVEGVRFTDADLALLAFVAEHVLTALERREGREELERRVRERTAQLAEANRSLLREVAERERGERLQTALYRIADLAGSHESSEDFYRHVHEIIGALLDAENFYIALISEDGQSIEFPYYVDETRRQPPSRAIGRGLTEYVIRHGRTTLLDFDHLSALVDEGELSPELRTESPSQCWVGAPLVGNGGCIGAVAVQSYKSSLAYDAADAELLQFVATQLSSSLQRRRDADALLDANQRLEARVEERTRELREQIAVREQVEAQLQHQVMHDALTGLPNRVYLRDRLERAIGRARRNGDDRFGLLYIDVDRFKLVNDSLGHLAGDQVLCEVARRLSATVREPDVVARLSGDEFAILLEQVPIPDTAVKIAQRILQAMEAPMQVAGQTLQTGTSIGVAIGDDGSASADQMLRDADTALYRAKSAGRNRFVMFDDALHRATMDQLALEQELRRAIAEDAFRPHFQPIVRLDDGGPVGYEALLRWNHPQRGPLPPGEFIQVAEESGLIEAIDWSLFRRAIQAASRLVRGDEFVTINVSPRMFHAEAFDARLLDLMRAEGCAPGRLRIEVTEGTLLGDPDAVEKVLLRLRDAGVEAALDDFGTGYSSLGYVHRFPLRMIKIDKSFVEQVGREASHRSAAVIGAILALARSLSLDVVAEGIETPEQRDALLAMGCRYGQGYLFGRPSPIEAWTFHGGAAG